jgi:hypothetical protein
VQDLLHCSRVIEYGTEVFVIQPSEVMGLPQSVLERIKRIRIS